MLRSLKAWLSRSRAPSQSAQPVPSSCAEPLPAGIAEQYYRHACEQYALGRLQPALESLQRAIDLRHDHVPALALQGEVLCGLGHEEDAEDSLRLALAFDAGHAGARLQLARLLRRRGDAAGAVDQLAPLAGVSGVDACVAFELGLAHEQLGDADAACRAYRLAAEADPRDPAPHVNLGVLLINQYGDGAGAEALFRQALALRPDMTEAQVNLGLAWLQQGRVDAALAHYEALAAARPHDPDVRWHRGLVRLLRGDYAGGWEDYEARKQREHGAYDRRFPYPEWDGSPLAGRTLLIYGEQGLGDEIMFASCVVQAAAHAASCVLECNRRLEPLMRRSFPALRIQGTERDGRREWLREYPDIDVQCAVGSLPRFLRRSAADFPHHSGYLHADTQAVGRWRKQLASLGPGLKVGIAWRGGGIKTRGGSRTLPLADWRPLFAVPQLRFVSLQHDAEPEEVKSAARAAGVDIACWSATGRDLDETAALISALDLVISVQGTTVHLAGALGRPVWVLLSYVPDWRYRLDGQSMPWYPSARLFRQPRASAWRAVLDEAASALADAVRRVTTGLAR
jgi:tetratricopeptide (TPR) repeat protein